MTPAALSVVFLLTSISSVVRSFSSGPPVLTLTPLFQTFWTDQRSIAIRESTTGKICGMCSCKRFYVEAYLCFICNCVENNVKILQSCQLQALWLNVHSCVCGQHNVPKHVPDRQYKETNTCCVVVLPGVYKYEKHFPKM